MSAPADVTFPTPDITPMNAPFWNSLAAGELMYQRCQSCQLAVLPARTECPRCWQPRLEWHRASGAAKLVSWIVYHHAFHPAFASRLPYTVAVVELSEGARLVSNIVDVADPEQLRIEMPLILTIEQESGFAVPRFRPVASMP